MQVAPGRRGLAGGLSLVRTKTMTKCGSALKIVLEPLQLAGIYCRFLLLPVSTDETSDPQSEVAASRDRDSRARHFHLFHRKNRFRGNPPTDWSWAERLMCRQKSLCRSWQKSLR
jgi:hypothetical protein